MTSVLLFAALIPGFAQKKSLPQGGDLSVDWELLNKSQHNSGRTLSVLTLKNNGKAALPASGWNIYFTSRSLRTVGPDSLTSRVKHVNGDLFRLLPLKGFKSLAPGAALKIQFVSDALNNHTEFPAGFYLVWDNNPGEGSNLKHLPFKAGSDKGTAEVAIAAKVYQQNQVIRDIPEAQLPQIFPTPSSYVKQEGTFQLGPDIKIVANGAFEQEAKVFAGELSAILGKKISVTTQDAGSAIVFQKVAGAAAESYKLSISKDKIVITASDAAGAFYAIQSLKTMFPAVAWAGVQKSISLPAAEITDAPRFGFRGFMMDVARNFQSKKEVLKVLDAMALYKLNVFHFHLNDDEGWRLEITGLPELTSVGSQRGHTVADEKNILSSYGSGAKAGSPSGSGFYTRADYIEILKYATERHIRVIPEIETPGHARAAIKSMDARYNRLMKAGQKAEAERYLLRDLNDKSDYRSVQGFNDNVVNVALPSVYNFLEKVTDELIAMHKEAGAVLNTVHFGGDEVPAGVWEKSPVVNALLKSNPEIKGTDELWHYYFSKVNALLKSRNLYLSGWEEIGLHKALVNGEKRMVVDPRFINENFHADVWNNMSGNEDLAYKMANAGYKVVLTCVTNFYIDLAVNKSFDERGQYWGGYVDVDKPFYFIPYDYYKNVKEDSEGNPADLSVFNGKVRLTEAGRANIVGLQAPLWSETIKTAQQFEYMFLPKVLGLAERAWAKDPEWALATDPQKSKELYDQAWSEFVNVLGKKELPRLSYYSGGFDYRIPTAGAVLSNGNVAANVQFPGFVVRYTVDGTEPVADSKVYTTPIPANGKVKLRVFNTLGRGSRTIEIK